MEDIIACAYFYDVATKELLQSGTMIGHEPELKIGAYFIGVGQWKQAWVVNLQIVGKLKGVPVYDVYVSNKRPIRRQD